VTGQHSLETDRCPDGIVDELREFFSRATAGNEPGPDEDYFALGLMNSLMALELISFVEQSFGIAVEVEDLDLDNFRTMNRTAEFVRRKRSALP
jgi:methoxymalonate biosynthesis acyl carrier protein